MALKDIVSTVLTRYRADTKDHRKELEKLMGAEREQMKAQIEGIEKGNEAIDGHIAMWAQVAVGVGAVLVAAKALEAGFETLQKNSRLARATVGVDLEGLRKATNGLVTDVQLLEFASRAMNGTFKLSQAEMEKSLQGVLGLRKEGVELEKALENVGKAVQEGSIEPLVEFGHVIRDVEAGTRQGLNAALNDLRKTASGTGGDFELAGDKMIESQVSMKNSVDQLKESLGNLALKLLPIVDKLAEMVGHVVWLAEWSQKNVPSFGGGRSIWQKVMAAGGRATGLGGLGEVRNMLGDQQGALAGVGALGGGVGGGGGIGGFGQIGRQAGSGRKNGFASQEAWNRMSANFTKSLEGLPDADPKKKKGPSAAEQKSRRKAREKEFWEKAMQAVTELAVDARVEGGDGVTGGFLDFSNFDRTMQGVGEGADASLTRVRENLAAIQEMQRGRTSSILADIFGTPTEIDAQTVALQAMAQTFDGFAGAFGQGIDAMITGSESFATAFKRGIAESLRAMAVDMSIQATKHGAMALGSLAISDVRGAATHGAAAGMFAAGALAAGTGAKLLGAGATPVASAGGAGRGAGAGPAGVGASRSADGPRESTRIVVLDNGFKDLSARERRSRVRQISRDAGIEIKGDVVTNG